MYTKKMVEKSSTSCQRGVEAKANIPVWKRYTPTITEAAEYYHIGETKLRNIVENHRNADFEILNGNRVLIKRQRFEDFLDKATTL